jgi:SAM-dependent methyltransferase
MTSTTEIAGQYTDSRKLAARARLHNYTVAPVGWFKWVAQGIGFAPSERVLDIGCGPAWFWAAIADTVPKSLELTLADQSAGMVAEAVERARPLGFAAVTGIEADASALPFADASFDVVVAMHMLYHVPDPAKAIAEFHRVLKPGGRLAATTNGRENMRELYALGTTFGGSPVEPVADAFGFEIAERLLRDRFGNVAFDEHPAHMRITEPEDIFLALTSYPPGENASPAQLDAFRAAIDDAFAKAGGTLEVRKQSGLFLSRKVG